jgi:diacylglycerol kinase family enzyme
MTSDPVALARAILAGRTASIDLGRADDEPFTIMASIGFDAAVVHRLSAVRTGAISHLSYVRPGLEVARSWRASRVSWRIDGECEELGEGLVVIGNMRAYGVGLNPTAEALHDDGLLDAVFIPARTAMELLPWVPLLRLGLAHRLPALPASVDSGYRMRRGGLIELPNSNSTATRRSLRPLRSGDPSGPRRGRSPSCAPRRFPDNPHRSTCP